MHDLTKILLTSFLTVFSGTIVYVISKVFIDLIIDFRKLTPEIIDTIIRYKYRIVNPGVGDNVQILEAQHGFNELRARLLYKSRAIPWYSFFVMTKLVIKREEIEKIARNLNNLSANIAISDPETKRDLNLPRANIELVEEIGKVIDYQFDI